VHSRIDETIARVTAHSGAGNVYVNRNLIGAVVGVQPFGGHGLSGTGPKAGGPLYLRRLLAACPARTGLPPGRAPAAAAAAAQAWQDWLAAQHPAEAATARDLLAATPAGVETELPGPVGERNLYATEPRGTVLCVADDPAALRQQVGMALATGNRVLAPGLGDLPAGLAAWVDTAADPTTAPCDAALFSGGPEALLAFGQRLAAREGPIVPVHGPGAALDGLVRERSTSINTAAAGGNASLMAIG
jgi:RHH-type proline utilization regulon transcriptional repressor/proline dehydrogenase/delta 1-pyrroline-5-carboxylate dehydrogenase